MPRLLPATCRADSVSVTFCAVHGRSFSPAYFPGVRQVQAYCNNELRALSQQTVLRQITPGIQTGMMAKPSPHARKEPTVENQHNGFRTNAMRQLSAGQRANGRPQRNCHSKSICAADICRRSSSRQRRIEDAYRVAIVTVPPAAHNRR